MTGRTGIGAARFGPVVMVVMAAGLFAVGAYAIAYAADVSVSTLTRDINPTMDLPWYVGTFSWLGVLIWFAGSAVAFAASWIAAPPHRGFLRTFGIFGMFLAVDDGFTLHDHTLKLLFGDSIELISYVVYAVVAVWIAVKWWRTLSPTALAFALVSVICLGASVLGDVVGAPSFVEDALKFVGIAAWAGLAVTQSGHAVRQAMNAGETVS